MEHSQLAKWDRGLPLTTRTSDNLRGSQPAGVSMASVTPANVDISDQFREKTHALKKQEKRVKELKKLLRSAERKYDRLKDDLSSYQSATGRPLINNLPEEILSIIFACSISENRRLVRRPLLVCKHWQHLVVHDPQMWNIIHLRIPENEWDMFSWAHSNRLFVTRCIERSRSALLHVTLDLECLLSVRKHLTERLHSGFWKLRLVNQDLVASWLENLDYDDLEPWIAIHFTSSAMIKKLMIRGGKLMKRWKPLELSLPLSSPDLGCYIWTMIDHPTPNLSHAHFLNMYHLHQIPKAEIFSATPNFSKVKHLTISELSNWDFVSFFPSSLEELAIHTSFSKKFTLDLARFSQLRILTIGRKFMNLGNVKGPETPKNIELPRLQELTFLGCFEQLDRVRFKLPVLKRLTLEWKHEDLMTQSLPRVHPLQVHWLPRARADCPPHFAKTIIQRFLSHFTGSENLSVPALQKPIVIDFLKQSSSKKTLPPGWKSISFHKDGEIVETMTIQEILSNA